MRLLLAVWVATLCVAHGGILDRLRSIGSNALHENDSSSNNVVEASNNEDNANGDEGNNPNDPTDEPPLVMPVNDIQPEDHQRLSFQPSDEKPCNQYTWGWGWSLPFNCPPITTNNGVVYYFNCRSWRPKGSGCRGDCGDSVEAMSAALGGDFFYKRHCECCTGKIAYLIKPYLYCYKLEIQWNPFSIVYQGYTWKPAIDNSHNYAVVGGCDCRRCTSVATFKSRIETAVQRKTRTMNENQVAMSDRMSPSYDDDQNQMDDIRKSISEHADLAPHMDQITRGMNA